MSLEINYNPIYNEVFPDVKAEIEARSKIYGSNTRGYMGTRFDWETTKQSWCVVYKVDTKNKTNKKPILGFNIDKREETFLGMYDQKYGVPRNPILEEVRISNQGSYGALQVADIKFRCFTLEQVDKFENDILKPGSDIEIKYGWSSGRVSSRAQTNKIHPKNIDPSIDTYRGITYNFNIAMENSLEWVIILKSVGEGFFLSGLSANASSKIVDANLTDAEHPKILSDSGIVLNYVRSLSEKIDFDVYNHTTDYIYSNDGSSAYPDTTENHFVSYVDSSAKDGSILRYARLRFLPVDSEKSKEQKKIDKPTTNSDTKVYDDIEIEIPLREEYSYQKSIYDTEKYPFHPYRLGDLPVIYIGLSDLLHFYNESIAGRSERFDMNKKRIYLSANYNAWRNTDGKQLDEEEQHKYFPYGIRSVSIYDAEMVSCSPNTILFNGGIDENDTYNSANYTVDPNNTNKSSYFDVRNGYYRIGESKSKTINGKTIVYDKPIKTQFQRIDNPKLCNLGEILINVDFVKSILSEVSSVNDIQEKSIFSLFKKIFDEIEYASAGLYKLTFIQENVENDTGEYMSWYNVIDMNFTYTQHKNLKPLRFYTHNDTKPIVRDINLSFKVPNALANALYVEGRYNINDVTGESGAIVGYLYPELLQDSDIKDKIENRQKKSFEMLRSAKAVIGRIGVTQKSVRTLYTALKEYRESPPINSSLFSNRTYINQTIYPINLSLTIDGISGFRFGNVIEVDSLPNRYYNKDGQARIIFIVTKVHHIISPHDWQTELETQCRGNMNIKI